MSTVDPMGFVDLGTSGAPVSSSARPPEPGIGGAEVAAYDEPPPLPPPTLTGISPATGVAGAQTPVTLTGTRLTGTNQVVFYLAPSTVEPATAIVVVSDTEVTCTAPGLSAGVYDVIRGGTGGQAHLPASFTVPAALNSITPNSGPVEGGTPVTITGTGFSTATGLQIGPAGTMATDVVVVDDSTITAVTPPNAAGGRNVTLIHPAGNVVRNSWYTYA